MVSWVLPLKFMRLQLLIIRVLLQDMFIMNSLWQLATMVSNLRTYEWEFGLEGKFLNNRAGLTSYYSERCKDQILRTTTVFLLAEHQY